MNSIELFANRYILNNTLGQGGMGIVYDAFDRLTGQKVALKQVLAPIDAIAITPTDSDESEQVALTREFQTLASLRHPNIINVMDYGFHKQELSNRLYPFFTMTLLRGAHDILLTSQEFANEAKLYLIIQVLQALEYLHKRGIIHHDLKPSNILVHNEQVKLLDFGLAIKSGESVGTQGTLPYMAPELLDGNPASVASDLYAVGIIAYELFVGRHPYNVKNLHNLIYDIMRTPPNVLPLEKIKFDERPGQIDPDIFAEFKTTNIWASRQEVDDFLTEIQNPINDFQPEKPEEKYVPRTSLARIIFRLLAKDPNRRYPDATTVMQAFNGLLDEPYFLETPEIRESYLQAASFVGRQNEQEAMAEALNCVQSGQGSAWLIGGESGVGKSRLIDEVRIHAMVEGALVLLGQSVKGGGVPYQAWRNILRRLCLMVDLTDLEAGVIKPLVPDIHRLIDRQVDDAPELNSKETKLRLVTSITNIIKRYPDPLVIILEDLQWMSDGMDILEALLGVCTEKPLMIVASFRDDERPNLPTKFPQMNFIKLERLTPHEITELSVSMLGTLGAQPRILNLLNKETEGNVFFLVETVRALAEEAGQLSKIANIEIPSTIFARGIQDIINRRLSGITTKHQAILQLASIMGREINLPLLEYIVKQNDTYEVKNISKWLDVCSSSAIIEISNEVWRFTHDKIRQGIVDQLTPEISCQLHTQVALAIEAMHEDLSDYAITLTNHWRLAENQHKEWQYSGLAGSLALDRGAFVEAARYLRRALNLYELLDEENQHWYLKSLHQLAQAYSFQGAFEESLHANEKCLEVVSQLDNNSLVVDITYLRGVIALRQGQIDVSKAYLQRALDLSITFDDKDEMRSLVLMWIGAVAIMEDDFSAADQNLQEAINLAQSLNGNDAQFASILNTQAENLRSQKRYEEAIPYYEQSIDLFTKIGHFHGLLAIPLNLAHTHYAMGNWELAEQSYYKILENSLSQNNAMITLGSLSGVASTKYMRNEVQDAIKLIGLVMRHPSTTAETKIFVAQPLIEILQDAVDEATYDSAFGFWRTDSLEEVAKQLII